MELHYLYKHTSTAVDPISPKNQTSLVLTQNHFRHYREITRDIRVVGFCMGSRTGVERLVEMEKNDSKARHLADKIIPNCLSENPINFESTRLPQLPCGWLSHSFRKNKYFSQFFLLWRLSWIGNCITYWPNINPFFKKPIIAIPFGHYELAAPRPFIMKIKKSISLTPPSCLYYLK